MEKKRYSRKRTAWPALGVTLGIISILTAAVLFWTEKTNRTELFNWLGGSTKIAENTDETATTTSTAASAQNDFTAGSARKEASKPNINEGTITDNNGSTVTPPAENTWVRSSDGSSVIVYSPINNQVLQTGQILSGASTATRVNFRLIDNISGVIAQGTLSVVNGKFSGVSSFKTVASDGRVDIFTSDDQGVESNNVSIPVRFAQ